MRFNFDGLLQGEIRQTYQAVYGDPDSPEDQVLEDVNENVTLAVRELVREYKAAVKLADKRAMELRDLKNRRWWDELELATDPNTGETLVVKTHYQLEMKQMTLHVTPEVMRSMRPTIGGYDDV